MQNSEAAALLALWGVDMHMREYFWKLVELGGWRRGWEVFHWLFYAFYILPCAHKLPIF